MLKMSFNEIKHNKSQKSVSIWFGTQSTYVFLYEGTDQNLDYRGF